MGLCFSDQQTRGKHQHSTPCQQNLEQAGQNKKSPVSITTNPEQFSTKYHEQISFKRRDEVPVATQMKHNQSFVSLSQLLEDEGKGGNHDWEMHNLQSLSIRMPKKDKSHGKMEDTFINASKKSQILSQVSQNQKSQQINGKMSQQEKYAILMIKLAQIDFQFILPKCRAGPLVVPFINYNMYQL